MGCSRIEERNDRFEASFKCQGELLKDLNILALKVTRIHHEIKNVARVSNLYRWKKQSSIPRYFVSNSLCVNKYQRKQSQNPQDFLIHDYFCFVLTSVVDFLHFEGLIVKQISKIEFVLV